MDYYVKDEDKRDEEEQGIKKGREEGIEKGRNDIIKKLLETMSPEEVSKTLEIPLNEIKIVIK